MTFSSSQTELANTYEIISASHKTDCTKVPLQPPHRSVSVSVPHTHSQSVTIVLPLHDSVTSDVTCLDLKHNYSQ